MYDPDYGEITWSSGTVTTVESDGGDYWINGTKGNFIDHAGNAPTEAEDGAAIGGAPTASSLYRAACRPVRDGGSQTEGRVGLAYALRMASCEQPTPILEIADPR